MRDSPHRLSSDGSDERLNYRDRSEYLVNQLFLADDKKLDVPVIMLWRTLVAVKVSVVKWVVRETLASPEGAAASALSAGCRYEVSEMRPP